MPKTNDVQDASRDDLVGDAEILPGEGNPTSDVSAADEQDHPGDGDPGRRVVYVYDGQLDLLGNEVKVGDMMPDFSLTAWRDETTTEIIPEDLLAYGRPILISVCSSVDTPVSNVQSSLLALRVKQYAGRVLGVLVTSDLPFTQNRFIREHQCEELIVGSDYLDRNFGYNWGLLIDEAMVLQRAIFVVDSDGTVCHAEVPERYTCEIDYDAALSVLDQLLL